VRPSVRSLLLFVALCAVLLLSSAHFFSAPFHEQGDPALNALRIHRAKSFEEIYGNYSRFHFSHPGPGFFYAYAAAEAVLTDRLQLLSPHCAHSLAGLLLQAGFFVVGLHIIGRYIRHPLFLPIALLIGALHFSEAREAFVSLWPPRVLLMPFFAFLVGCVSVSLGRGRDLFWVVLSGCFLVHGHVAQPLFVVSLSLLSYVLWWRHLRRRSETPATPWKAAPWVHVACVATIGLFLVPIVIDLTKGAESNFHEILRHLQYAGEKKKFLKSVLYFLSFFVYLENQHEVLQRLSWESAQFLREHALLLFGWLTLIGLVIWRVLRADDKQAEHTRFIRRALFFWTVTALLCLYWGRMQAGPMWQYNGYFYYAHLYLLLLCAAAVACEWIPERIGRWIGIPVFAAAAVFAWRGLPYPPFSEAESGVVLRRQTEAALAADPNRGQPKVLVFSHNDWPEVASASVVLARAGVPFYVDASWTFMFQKHHELSTELATTAAGKLSVWRFIRTKREIGMPFAEHLRIVFDVPTLPPVGGVIDFSDEGNFVEYQLSGFSTPAEGDYAPTAQKDAVLQFRPEPTTHDVDIHIQAEPFLGAGKQKVQPTELRFNGHLVFSAPFTEPGVLRARIPKEVWNSAPVATVHLTMPNALSPAEMGLSGDVRRLGLSVKKLITLESPPLPQ
jgi:hypothetical protein